LCGRKYAGAPSCEDLARYFHLDEADRKLITQKRADHNRLGFALQLTTVRFLGTFLAEPTRVSPAVISTVSKQLDIENPDCLSAYLDNRRHWAHAAEIRTHFEYREFVDPGVGFRLSRWLYAQCWTGTDRPSILFEHATAWLLAHKVLLVSQG